MTKQNGILYFEVVGDISNEEIFKINNESYYQLIGYSLVNNREIYFKSIPISLDDSEFSSLIEKTDKQVFIEKKTLPDDIYVKVDNPMWFYSYDGINVKLIRSVYTEKW